MDQSVDFGRFRVFTGRRELWADGRPAPIGARALDVLIALLARPGELVTKDELLSQVWAGAAVEDGAIAAQIAAVRRALGDGENGVRWVQTVPGRGYRFVGDLTPSSRGEPAKRSIGGFGRRSWPGSRAVGVLIVAATVAGGAWFARERLGESPKPAEIRVAVLPFDTLSPGRDARYLADGLLDKLLVVLSSNQVEVVSRPDSALLRGGGARQAIDRLGVSLLLDGTVRVDGQMVFVRVHIDDVRRHFVLWSRDFTGTVEDSEALQTVVAGHTTEIARWLLSDRYGIAQSRVDASTIAALHDAGDEMQSGDNDRAVSIYRGVISRSPGFSYGHSGLGVALGIAASAAAPIDQPRILAEARREAMRALALDPRNGEGYYVLAASTPGSAWAEREALVLKGLRVDPVPTYLPFQYAAFLGEVGRVREALAMERRATAADPYWAPPGAWLPVRMGDIGQVEGARKAMARAKRLWPNDPSVNMLLTYLTVWTAPEVEALRYLDGPNSAPSFWTPQAMAVWRRFVQARVSRDAARRAATARAVRAAAEAGVFHLPDTVIALSTLGDIDGALVNADRYLTDEGLRQPYVLGQADTHFLFTAATGSMRQDPRFMGIVSRIGLTGYWRSSGHWPDFCDDPKLPYDCKAEAAKFVAG